MANHLERFLAAGLMKQLPQAPLGKKTDDWMKIFADEGSSSEPKRNRLKVLVDGDGMRLLMNLYQDYVSDEEYQNFLEFAMEVDDLLYRHRGNKPLTREEKEIMEDSAPKRKKNPIKKKTKPAAPSGESSGNGGGESGSGSGEGNKVEASDEDYEVGELNGRGKDREKNEELYNRFLNDYKTRIAPKLYKEKAEKIKKEGLHIDDLLADNYFTALGAGASPKEAREFAHLALKAIEFDSRGRILDPNPNSEWAKKSKEYEKRSMEASDNTANKIASFMASHLGAKKR